MRDLTSIRLGILGASLSLNAVSAGATESPDLPPINMRDELFQQVFRHAPPPFPVESQVLVIVDVNIRMRMRAIRAPETGELLLDGRELTALLSQYLRRDVIEQMKLRMDSQGLLDPAAIEGAGIAANFDPHRFEYTLSTAQETRLPSVVYVTPPLPDANQALAIRPAAISGFVNFNAKGVDRRSIVAAHSRQSQGVAIALDGAMNISGVVIEGSAFSGAGAAQWDRGDLRLVYDRPRQALRWTAGDLNYPVTGYQTGVAIGGIGVTKDYALQPQVLTYWTGDFTFRLDRAAQVKLFSNDSQISTLQLPPGIHDLRRFTPAVGQNDIDIVIEDSAGTREVLHYSFIHDPRLLTLGLSLYSWNAGFARTIQDGRYHYDTQKPVFAGAYQLGFTPTTTLGGYMEHQDAHSLFGVHALHALSVGTVLLGGAASLSRDGQWDAAARLALNLQARPHAPETYVAVEYVGNRFRSGGALPQNSRDALHVQASMATSVGHGWTASLNGSYYSAQGPRSQSRRDASVTMLQRWGRYVNVSYSLRSGWVEGRGSSTQALFGIRANFAHETGSYRLSKDLEHHGVDAHWSSPRRNSISSPYGFAAASTGPRARAYEGGAGYWGNQGLAEITYRRDQSTPATTRDLREETSVRLQGALAFAGDQFALSRPIRENFAIVTGKLGLQGVAMKVDPSRDGNNARSGWLSPAVVTDLSSYRLRSVSVHPVDPPPGATPEKLSYQLAPTYKSGLLLSIGKEPRVVATGRLVDTAGTPIAYASLEIRRQGFPEERPIQTFTGRNGNFQADLGPGSYELRISRAEAAIVDVHHNSEGIVTLGDIHLGPVL